MRLDDLVAVIVHASQRHHLRFQTGGPVDRIVVLSLDRPAKFAEHAPRTARAHTYRDEPCFGISVSAKTILDTYGNLWPDKDESSKAAVAAIFAERPTMIEGSAGATP